VLLTPVIVDDLPDLIDDVGNVVYSNEKVEVFVGAIDTKRPPGPVRGTSRRQDRRVRRRRRRRAVEVSEFTFTKKELRQKAAYEKACLLKKIVIEEIDDDDEDTEVPFEPESVTMPGLNKNQRKRRNRSAAKLAAKREEERFNAILSDFISVQGWSKTREQQNIESNVSVMQSIGFSRKEVEAFLFEHDCSKKVFPMRVFKRAMRENIQRAAAKLRQRQAFSFDERVAVRRAQRDFKYVESQSPMLVAATCASAILSMVSIARSTRKIETKAVGLMDMVSEHMQKLADFLKQYGVIIKTAVLYSVSMYVWYNVSNPIIRFGIPLVCGALCPEAGDATLEFFKKMVDGSQAQVQSGSVFELLPKLLSVVVLYTVGIKGKSNVLAAAIDAVSKLPRTVKGVESLIDFALSGVEAVLNVINKFLSRPEFKFRSKMTKEVDNVIKRVWELDRKITARDFDVSKSPGVYGECMSCFSELVRLLGVFHYDKDVRMELSQARNIISNHCSSLRTTLGHGAGFRVEPVSVVIESDPGVGKTMQLPVLIGSVLQKSGILPDLKPDTTHQAFFTRPPNSEYFDGYYGQECYYIDDLFAVKPVPGKVSHFEDVMSFYGTVTTMLNMAECEKKGMFPFTSSLLLMTTNVKSLSEVCASAILVKPAAFKRRFDIHVHVEVKPEYAKDNDPTALDYKKYLNEREKLKAAGKWGFDAHPWYIWEAWDTSFDVETTFVRGSGQCFSTVVKRIIEALEYKRLSHNLDMEHLARVLATGPVEQSGSLINTPLTARNAMYAEQDSVIGSDEDEEDPADDWSIPLRDFSTISSYRASLKAPLSADSADFEVVGKAGVNKNVMRRKLSFDPRHASSLVASAFMKLASIDPLILACLALAVVSVVQKFQEKPKYVEQSNGPVVVNNNGYRVPTVQSVGINTLHDKIYKQSYKVVVDLGERETTSLGQLLFIAGNICVMPNHFIEQMNKALEAGSATNATRVYLLPGIHTGSKIVTTLGAFLSYPRLSDTDNDICFVNFQKGVKLYPNIVKHVLKEKEIRSIGGRKVALHLALKTCIDEVESCRQHITISEARVGTSPLPADTRSYPNWFGYNATTEKGHCGAPLMLTDSRFYSCRVVAGLHVAGAPRYDMGYATFLSQEMCEKALDYFSHVDCPEATHEQSEWPLDIEVQSIDQVPFMEDGTLGSASPLYLVSDGPSAPLRSKLVKTGFGEEKFFDFEISTMNEGREPPELVPMKLGPYTAEDGTRAFPMLEAVKPFVGDVFIPPLKSFEKGLSVGLKPLSHATRNYEARRLSFEEAVVGVTVMGLKSITRATSVGFPLCMKASDKRYFFGDADDFDLSSPVAIELADQVERLEGLLKSGVRPQFVCRDFLKDETRKKGKVARLIAGTDIRYYILCRMYFGAFVGAICRSHAETGLCLGMNPYSEWGTLRSLLLAPDPSGDNVWDGDFGGFDSSQMPRLLWDCLDYINNWYSMRGDSAGNKIREILFLDLVSSRHLMSLIGKATTVVEWSKSLPSGHFLTSTINSMLSMGLVAASYVGLTGRLDFWSTSAAVVLGDDNVVSTSPEFVHAFNQVTVSKYLHDTFDMVYTAGRKGEELRPVIGIADVVFLQRRFAEKNGRVVCPIRPESFLHSLYYVKTCDHAKSREVLHAGIELAFEELSMHKEEYWGLVAPKLAEAKMRLDGVPNFPIGNSDCYFDLVVNRVPSYI